MFQYLTEVAFNSTLLIYLVIGILAYLECAAFAGLVAPGETFVAFGGFLAYKGVIELQILIPLVILTSILGDNTGFFLGKILGRDFLYRSHKLFRIPENYVVAAESYFKKHGGKTMLIARFVGFLRALTPFLSGAFKARYLEFFIFDLIGASAWGLIVVMGGYYLGEGYQLIEKYLGRAGLILLVIVGVVYIAVKLIKNYGPVVSNIRAILKKELIILTWFLISASLFVVIAGDVTEHKTLVFDTEVLKIIHLISGPILDRIAVAITFMGSTYFIVLMVFTVFLSLYLSRKKVFAWLYGGTVFSGVLLSYLFKYAIHRSRPEIWETVIEYPTYSFPSGHTVASAVAFWMIGWIAMRELKGRARLISLVFYLIPILVGFSRLYLGVHWPTDVLGGYALAFAVLAPWIYFFEKVRQNT